jgi:hypothetical protein
MTGQLMSWGGDRSVDQSDQLRECHMAGGGAKRAAADVEADAQPAGAEVEALTAAQFLHDELNDQSDVAIIRAEFNASLKQTKQEGDDRISRMRRDQEASDQGNKWHKGLNMQLDLHEDTMALIKSAERRLRDTFILIPSVDAKKALLEGRAVKIDSFEPLGLKTLGGVHDALQDLNAATGLVAKRSVQINIVLSADSAKEGFRTLDIMAGYGSIDPGAEKALKEAKRQLEDEDAESKRKKSAANKYQNQYERPRYDNHARGREQREEPRSYNEPRYQVDWGKENNSRSHGSGPDHPRGGSMNMPYGGGKGGSRSGPDGSCNSCGEMGHWARECPRRRNSGY